MAARRLVEARKKDRSRNTPRPRQLPSREGSALVRWTKAKADSLASSLSADDFIQFDRYAIWFLILCLAYLGSRRWQISMVLRLASTASSDMRRPKSLCWE